NCLNFISSPGCVFSEQASGYAAFLTSNLHCASLESSGVTTPSPGLPGRAVPPFDRSIPGFKPHP
ncbi:MAG: hypothetical protein AB7O69_02020, partial [Burkholderiales bacterium]